MAHFEALTLPRPEYFNFAVDVVDYWASKSPAPIAMHWISRDDPGPLKTLDFAHFSRQSHRIAVLFEHLGIKRGDRMVIILPRVPEWWEITTAALRMGVVVCPSTMLLVEHDIKYRCHASRATIIVGNGSSLTKFGRVRKECPLVSVILQTDCAHNSRDDVYISLPAALSTIPADAVYTGPKTKASDPSMIYFTSGTAGPPKMVQHNHISYPLASTITGKHWLRLAPGKTYWALTEQGWAKAAWAYFGAWNCGAALFIEDDTGAFDRHHTLNILHKYPITTFCAPPTVYRQLVLDDSVAYFKKHRPKALVHCTGAGEPLNPEAIKIWESMSGIQICDGYGQTESILVCGNFEGNSIKFGSMGKPSPGVPLSLVDDEGNELPANEEGNIAILADTGDGSPVFFGLFDGYLKEGGTPERPLCHTLDANGKPTGRSWFLTGDRATCDADGYFWFVGRADDVINSSGYRIGPFEVESVLKQLPYVVESAVVSSPDSSRGELVKAFIVLTDSHTRHDPVKLTRDIQDFCKKNAAPYKYPRKIQFVDSAFLPKTISGKIRRKELKRMEYEGVKEGRGVGREVKL